MLTRGVTDQTIFLTTSLVTPRPKLLISKLGANYNIYWGTQNSPNYPITAAGFSQTGAPIGSSGAVTNLAAISATSDLMLFGGSYGGYNLPNYQPIATPFSLLNTYGFVKYFGPSITNGTLSKYYFGYDLGVNLVTYYVQTQSDTYLILVDSYNSTVAYTLADAGALTDGTSQAVQLQDGSNTTLVVSWRAATGAKISFTGLLNGGTGFTQDLPSTVVGSVPILATPDGNVVYAASDAGQIVVSRMNGSTHAISQVAVSPVSKVCVEPQITLLANGDFVVVWRDQTTDLIDGRLLDPNLNPLGGVFQASTYADHGVGGPVVVGLPNNNFAVAWSNDDGQTASIQQSLFGAGAGLNLPDDFAGNGVSGVLWRHATGSVEIWNGTPAAPGNFAGGTPLAIGNDWQIAGVGDFNGAGVDGVLWRNANGDLTTWNSQAAQPQSFAGNGGPTYHVGLDWQVEAVGDFNGDGLTDILWANANGWVDIWNALPSSGGAFSAQPGLFVGSRWQVAGVGDFNGSGIDGILWRNLDGVVTTWNSTTGAPERFTNNGGPSYAVGTDWQIAGVGDFNGDGISDIAWRNLDGTVQIWMNQGNASFMPLQPQPTGMDWQVSTDWKIVDIGEYNGDGKSDILWRNVNSGDVTAWESNPGSTIAFSAVDLGVVGADWQVVGAK